MWIYWLTGNKDGYKFKKASLSLIDMFRTPRLCQGSTLSLKDHLAEFIRTLNIKVNDVDSPFLYKVDYQQTVWAQTVVWCAPLYVLHEYTLFCSAPEQTGIFHLFMSGGGSSILDYCFVSTIMAKVVLSQAKNLADFHL